MAIDGNMGGPKSPFERMLDALDDEDWPLARRGASVGAERLWPGACASSLGQGYSQGGAVERFYEESQTGAEIPAPAEKPKKPATIVNFSEIQRQLSAARTLDELRRVRRRCALAAHPDRVDPLERPLAEKLMAEVNAAVDRAIRDRTFAPQKT